MRDKDKATRLALHYFRLIGKAAGVTWWNDNDSEIEEMIERIISAATATEEAQPASPICQTSIRGTTNRPIAKQLTRIADALEAIALVQSPEWMPPSHRHSTDPAPTGECCACPHELYPVDCDCDCHATAYTAEHNANPLATPDDELAQQLKEANAELEGTIVWAGELMDERGLCDQADEVYGAWKKLDAVLNKLDLT